MPSELRRLMFRNDELIAAIAEYNAASKKKFPAGRIVACKPIAGPGVAVRIELADEGRDAPLVIDLTPEMVAAALLRYCINRGIPVPRKAEKSIAAHGNGICLNIRVKADPPKDVPPKGGPARQA